MKGTKVTMNDKPFWSRIVETAAHQIRNGWMLIPVTVGLSISILRIGLLMSCLVLLAGIGVLLVRKYRITIRAREDS